MVTALSGAQGVGGASNFLRRPQAKDKPSPYEGEDEQILAVKIDHCEPLAASQSENDMLLCYAMC